MAKKLTKNVYVDATLYGPDGEKPSAAVAKQITNEKVWEDDGDEADATPADAVAQEQEQEALDAAAGKTPSSKK